MSLHLAQVNVPRGWVWTTLGEASLINPRSFVRAPQENQMVSFIPMAAVEAVTGRMDTGQVRVYGEVKKGYTPFSEGDVLFAKITPCMENGKIAVAKGLENGSGCGSTEFHVLRPLNGMPGELLMYYLLQDNFRKEARGQMTGTAGQLRVPARFLDEWPFLLPPLPEQHRVVAEIEKHLTRLDAAVASLQRARANLKRYRASVLKAACEGRLVPTEAELARREGRDYEPASVLLERILKERRARWEAHGKRRGKYREAQPPDTSNLPPLPEDWVWASIGQCFGVHVGATPSRARSEYWGGNIPWVSSGEVAFSRVRQTRETITENGFHGANLVLHPPGTVLLGMIGEGKTRGQVAILDIAACNNQNSAAIRVSETDLVPEYLYYFLWSAYEHVRKRGSGGNQPALNRYRVEEIVFPLPPLAEQRRIVAEVERHLSVIQAAEEIVEGNLKRSDRLRQAILRRAFEGKLVPQDPTDEPASVLLERIRAERELVGRNTIEARRKVSRRRKTELGRHAGPYEIRR